VRDPLQLPAAQDARDGSAIVRMMLERDGPAGAGPSMTAAVCQSRGLSDDWTRRASSPRPYPVSADRRVFGPRSFDGFRPSRCDACPIFQSWVGGVVGRELCFRWSGGCWRWVFAATSRGMYGFLLAQRAQDDDDGGTAGHPGDRISAQRVAAICRSCPQILRRELRQNRLIIRPGRSRGPRRSEAAPHWWFIDGR
jgi:hypothetical protein